MMKRFSRAVPPGLLLVVLVGLSVPTARADEGIRAVQATLKTKGYYYGTPSGTVDADTQSALRRFQIHEGLPVNGELDVATSKALGYAGKAPANPKEAGSPPVAPPSTLRGESAGPLKASDREFLQHLNEQTPIPRELVRPTPTTSLPDPVAPPRGAVPPPRVVSPPRAVPPPRVAVAPPVPASAGDVSGEIATFLNNYLVAGASPEVGGELSQYADMVDYFNNGRVNREFIRRDTTNYRRRWPQREYHLEGKPAVLSISPDGEAATVRFRLGYRVRAGSQAAAGHTESTMELRRGRDGRFKIVSIKEKTLH